MIEIDINKKLVQVEESWDELRLSTLLAIADVKFNVDASPENLLHQLNYILMNGCRLIDGIYPFNSKKIPKAKRADFEFLAHQLNELGIYEKMLWMLEEPKCTQQLLPVINDLYGVVCKPIPFYNLRMKEWMLADQLFGEVIQLLVASNQFLVNTNTEELLNSFVGMLYRPKGIGKAYDNESPEYKGDIREVFNDALLDNGVYAKRAESIDITTKKAVVLWYWACRSWFVKEYKDVFDGGGDGEAHPAELIIGVAESQVFGNKEGVENAFVHDVMIYLQRSIRNAKAASQ